MTIRPLYDRIVVKRIEEKQQMQGGLHIPDSAQEKPQEAEVTAVGKGKRLEDGKIVPLDVKVGDRVLLGKYAGNEIKLDGQELSDHSRGRSARRRAKAPRSWRRRPKRIQGEYHGSKTDRIQREFPASNLARRQPIGGHGEDHLGTEGPQRSPGEEIRRPDHHQGWRDRGERDRAERSAREHGRPDGARGCVEDLGCRGRRHHHGHHSRAGDLSRGREERGRGREPDGAEARHRGGGRSWSSRK